MVIFLLDSLKIASLKKVGSFGVWPRNRLRNGVKGFWYRGRVSQSQQHTPTRHFVVPPPGHVYTLVRASLSPKLVDFRSDVSSLLACALSGIRRRMISAVVKVGSHVKPKFSNSCCQVQIGVHTDKRKTADRSTCLHDMNAERFC